MFKAVVRVTESTGAGYGLKPHVYVSGKGVAFSKSPKKAMRTASILAEISRSENCVKLGLPKGIGLIPVFQEIQLFKDDKEILTVVD